MKTRVLFVCIGNAVRSQMAEGFAKTYGRDIVTPASAGLAPAASVDPTAARLMADIGIDISEQFSKHFLPMTRLPFEIVVNISGHPLPAPVSGRVIEWAVDDPVGRSDEDYRRARDLIQKKTLGLIDELRLAAPAVAQPVTATDTPGRLAIEAAPKRLLDRKRRLR